MIYSFIFVFSVSITFMNLSFAELFEDSELRGGIYTQVLGHPLVWLQFGLIVGVVGLTLWFS